MKVMFLSNLCCSSWFCFLHISCQPHNQAMPRYATCAFSIALEKRRKQEEKLEDVRAAMFPQSFTSIFFLSVLNFAESPHISLPTSESNGWICGVWSSFFGLGITCIHYLCFSVDFVAILPCFLLVSHLKNYCIESSSAEISRDGSLLFIQPHINECMEKHVHHIKF